MDKPKIKHLFKETLSISKIALANTGNYLSNAYKNYNEKIIEEQKQKQAQLQMQMKQNEIAMVQQTMIILAEQIAPAFYNHKYEFLEKIYAPSNLRTESYRILNNTWIFSFSLDKSCDIPIPPQDLKELKQKLAQDMNRYMCELQLYKPIEIIQMNYFLILNNPIIIDILDDNPKRKVYIDIQLTP